MTNISQTFPLKYLLVLILITLSGCSAIDSYRIPNQTTARSLPQIPEIRRQQTVKPRNTAPKKAVISAPISSRVVVKSYPKKTVQRNLPEITKQQKLEEQKRLQEQAKQNATVDVDPYATIPDNSSKNRIFTKPINSNNSTTLTRSSSPAVKTLMVSARADIALGKSRSAISKLERGLRIEPQNALLWHMLAKAHYSNSAYLHSISIAKKSNSNTNNSDLINENWKLIKQAGERSGNASAIKEALDYMKLNP